MCIRNRKTICVLKKLQFRKKTLNNRKVTNKASKKKERKLKAKYNVQKKEIAIESSQQSKQSKNDNNKLLS